MNEQRIIDFLIHCYQSREEKLTKLKELIFQLEIEQVLTKSECLYVLISRLVPIIQQHEIYLVNGEKGCIEQGQLLTWPLNIKDSQKNLAARLIRINSVNQMKLQRCTIGEASRMQDTINQNMNFRDQIGKQIRDGCFQNDLDVFKFALKNSHQRLDNEMSRAKILQQKKISNPDRKIQEFKDEPIVVETLFCNNMLHKHIAYLQNFEKISKKDNEFTSTHEILCMEAPQSSANDEMLLQKENNDKLFQKFLQPNKYLNRNIGAWIKSQNKKSKQSFIKRIFKCQQDLIKRNETIKQQEDHFMSVYLKEQKELEEEKKKRYEFAMQKELELKQREQSQKQQMKEEIENKKQRNQLFKDIKERYEKQQQEQCQQVKQEAEKESSTSQNGQSIQGSRKTSQQSEFEITYIKTIPSKPSSRKASEENKNCNSQQINFDQLMNTYDQVTKIQKTNIQNAKMEILQFLERRKTITQRQKMIASELLQKPKSEETDYNIQTEQKENNQNKLHFLEKTHKNMETDNFSKLKRAPISNFEHQDENQISSPSLMQNSSSKYLNLKRHEQQIDSNQLIKNKIDNKINKQQNENLNKQSQENLLSQIQKQFIGFQDQNQKSLNSARSEFLQSDTGQKIQQIIKLSEQRREEQYFKRSLLKQTSKYPISNNNDNTFNKNLNTSREVQEYYEPDQEKLQKLLKQQSQPLQLQNESNSDRVSRLISPKSRMFKQKVDMQEDLKSPKFSAPKLRKQSNGEDNIEHNIQYNGFQIDNNCQSKILNFMFKSNANNSIKGKQENLHVRRSLQNIKNEQSIVISSANQKDRPEHANNNNFPLIKNNENKKIDKQKQFSMDLKPNQESSTDNLKMYIQEIKKNNRSNAQQIKFDKYDTLLSDHNFDYKLKSNLQKSYKGLSQVFQQK